MKKSKIIVPALGILVLSTAASITGTVAWFSVNNSTKVEGMVVNTKVTSNLLIASANTTDDLYGVNLRQGRSATLEPVSTVDGVNFFYTASENVKGDGDAKTDAYIAYSEAPDGAPATNEFDNSAAADKTHFDEDFNDNYGFTHTGVTASNYCYGYIDYTFYLKATAVGGNKEVRMTVCNLSYAGAAMSGGETAWRVGLFSQEVAETAAGSGIGTNRSLLAQSGAVHHTAGKAVNSTTTLDTVTYGTAAVVGTVANGVTQRYKVVVRLWLEGEDKTCTNETYATLTSDYKLNLEFSVDGATAAVTTLGEAAHTDEIA